MCALVRLTTRRARTRAMTAENAEVLELLDLQTQGKGVFLGPPERAARSRVFGGHVVAQALAAASFTVDGRPCHSMHAYFLRPGKPGRPIEYEVSAMRDGNSFATRKVIGVQRDEVILELTASFDVGSPGAEHRLAMPDVPAPESYPGEAEREALALAATPPELQEMVRHRWPMEVIRVNPRAFGDRTPDTAPVMTWMRMRGALMDDANLHRCALAYASDLGALEPTMRAIGLAFGDTSWQVASLDHALWFHRTFRFDEWLLFVFDSASVASGRGLNRGSVFTRDGVLVASVAQESLARGRDPNAPV
jgi:acyl-CoA thioesterase-2